MIEKVWKNGIVSEIMVNQIAGKSNHHHYHHFQIQNTLAIHIYFLKIK